MPRKTSQAVKKDAAAADSKSEAGAPRRSGRAVTKQESSSGREATRSRRSSTAAQTAASVADSKTPKGRSSVSSRRESASPSDNRNRSGREGGVEKESPATRVKSTRRSTGRVNYKESDGEEETATPKYDDNFESSEEFEESESDEKSKRKGRSRPTKAVTKSRGAKDKAKNSRSRKSRSTEKKADDNEDDEGFEASDDSQEPEIISTGKRGKTAPVKEAPRSSRSRKQKTETAEVKKPAVEDKPKPSRRSARATSNKEETPKKRPSRRVQAKRYTEEEDDEEDIEETGVSKEEEEEVEEYVKSETEGSRKRKRASASEANKRLKETESVEDDQIEEDDEKKVEDLDEKDSEPETKMEVKDDKVDKDQSIDEPMEVDELDSTDVTKTEAKLSPVKNETEAEDAKSNEDKPEDNKDKEQTVFSLAKEKLSAANKQESIDSSENLDESNHSSDSEQGSRAEHSLSSGLEDSQDSKEQKEEKVPDTKTSIESNEKQDDVDLSSQSSESLQQIDDSSDEPKAVTITGISAEQKSEKMEKAESNVDLKSRTDTLKNDSSFMPESKTSEPDLSPSAPSSTGSTIPSTISHSKESNCDVPMNGSENMTVTNPPAHVIHSTSSVILEHKEDPAPKANGAHNDLHNSTTPPSDQYYLLPGRKYVVNCKISESIRQSIKDQTFGFVSYNLGSPSYDPYLQKDKILNELNNLSAHIICLQQVARPFFISVLQPSLDALGFKGDFCQPEDSLKGTVTFYKTSLFRITGRSEISLKHLIEKELEVSSLDANDRLAVRTHIKRCGSVCFTQLTTVIGNHTITIANVQIPPTDPSVHALQVSCLAREIVRISGEANKPLLLGGEFNMMESEAPYQLLRDGYLTNDMIEELQRRKDVALPGKENAALLNLLWKSFQHPSSNLCSCYKSVLDHEISIPELKITSPDLLWYSSDSLYAVGVLDIISEKPGERHLSLKADVAFSV